MISIDVRFAKNRVESLRNMVEKKTIKYMHDLFMFSASVYGVAGICFEDCCFRLTNLVKNRRIPNGTYGGVGDR